jgi:RNA polymerase sigma factor (sigma-70 family)
MARLMSKLPFQLPPDDAPSRASGQADWEVLSRRLGKIALALSRTREDADDLVQQTIAALLTKTPEHADHFGYARRTLIRLWLDGRRSLRRRLTHLALRAAASARFFLPADSLESGEQFARARAAIESLPDRQRAAFVLRVIEGLEYAQIAEELSCEVPAVRANLHLARASLRRALGEES